MLRPLHIMMLALPVALATPALAQDGRNRQDFRIHLSGSQEVPTVITSGRGSAVLRNVGNTVQYNVRYRDLQSDIEQAHIHIGANDTTGGVAVFLCSDLTEPAPPAGTPPCPASPGQLVGVIDAAEVIGPTAQGIAPGNIGALQRAIRAGLVYINIHTVVSPAGEIRGDVGHHWPF